MNKIGIVGSEAAKFTLESERRAREAIRTIIAERHTSLVVSGACHLGGIDIWAIEEAKKLLIETKEYPPKFLRWEGGYKQRNIQIAAFSNECYCITVDELPEGYKGMKFSTCYHCPVGTPSHVKSGGCWTLKQARAYGKRTGLYIIGQSSGTISHINKET